MQENIIPLTTIKTEKSLNSLFSNRPIQLLDIANSNKESIEKINMKQFLKDSFIDAEKHINKTYRNEIFQKYENEGYYKQEKRFYDKTEQKNTCNIYQLTEKGINKSCHNENKNDTENKILLQRYNIITGKGYYKDREINRIANTIYEKAFLLADKAEKNNTIIPRYKDGIYTLTETTQQYLLELTNIIIEDDNENYIKHAKYEYQKAIQILYYFSNAAFYDKEYVENKYEDIRDMLLYKWETKKVFRTETNYPTSINALIYQNSDLFEENTRKDYENSINNFIEKIYAIQDTLKINRRKNNQQWYNNQNELTKKKIDEISKVLSHDYRKLWKKHHIYTLHKIINNKIAEKESTKYKNHTQQQIDKIANEIENIRQQEGKTRQQQIENEAIVFANQYR